MQPHYFMIFSQKLLYCPTEEYLCIFCFQLYLRHHEKSYLGGDNLSGSYSESSSESRCVSRRRLVWGVSIGLFIILISIICVVIYLADLRGTCLYYLFSIQYIFMVCHLQAYCGGLVQNMFTVPIACVISYVLEV